jgi:hypothetical protein
MWRCLPRRISFVEPRGVWQRHRTFDRTSKGHYGYFLVAIFDKWRLSVFFASCLYTSSLYIIGDGAWSIGNVMLKFSPVSHSYPRLMESIKSRVFNGHQNVRSRIPPGGLARKRFAQKKNAFYFASPLFDMPPLSLNGTPHRIDRHAALLGACAMM